MVILLEIDISAQGTSSTDYQIIYEYMHKRGVLAYIRSASNSIREPIDFQKYKAFKPTLTPNGSNMVLTLPGLSHNFMFMKSPDKRMLRFIQSEHDSVPFDTLHITLVGTTFDGTIYYTTEGSATSNTALDGTSDYRIRFNTSSTDIINNIIRTKIADQTQSVVSSLLSVF